MNNQPAVQHLAPGVVLLSGAGVEVARYACRVAAASRQRNGYPVLGALAELAAALAEPGQPDVDFTALADAGRNDIDVQEAAKLMHCSPRQARRLAPLLDGRKVAGRWMVSRSAVAEHIGGAAA